MPSAARPAKTRAALTGKSVAFTGAPVSAGTPSMTALRPSILILAFYAFESSTCIKRFSKMVSVMTLVPPGDGEHGHGLDLHIRRETRVGQGVLMSVAERESLPMTSIPSSRSSILTPTSSNLAITGLRWSTRAF